MNSVQPKKNKPARLCRAFISNNTRYDDRNRDDEENEQAAHSAQSQSEILSLEGVHLAGDAFDYRMSAVANEVATIEWNHRNQIGEAQEEVYPSQPEEEVEGCEHAFGAQSRSDCPVSGGEHRALLKIHRMTVESDRHAEHRQRCEDGPDDFLPWAETVVEEISPIVHCSGTGLQSADPEESGEHEGYETHGMAGDVIVYRKNGGNDTPVIHRALLKAVANPEGGWDVPGTDIVGVSEITIELDYDCFHGNTKLTIERWVPAHEGYLTTGDNKWSNGCQIDQLRARYPDLSEQQIRGQGLKDEHGQPVQAVKDEWVVGVASLELPWIGAIKLAASGTGDQVPSKSWSRLLVVVASIITAPVVLEMIADRISGSRSDSDDELGSSEEE